jgi:antirestriction protein ArdC
MAKAKAPRSKKSNRKSKAPKRTQADLFQDVTDRIIAAMESGEVAPWHRPWKATAVGSMNLPHNVRGNAYRGVNVWLTMMTAWSRSYRSMVWMTFKQAHEIAAKAMRAAGRKVEQNERGTYVFADGEDKGKSVGGIRKGQSAKNDCGGTSIVFWKKTSYTVEDEDGEEKKRSGMLLKFYTVFNLEQCDEHVVDYVNRAKAEALAKLPEFNPIAECERIVEGYDVTTKHDGGNRAFYNIVTDSIHLPKRKTFDSPEHYYTTRFHEMGHSTGAAHRLDRKGLKLIRDRHDYAEEELVAEFTACFLAAEAGIVRTVENNSASYLKSWASKLRDDPRLVVYAAQRAQKAADLILGREASAENAEREAA